MPRPVAAAAAGEASQRSGEGAPFESLTHSPSIAAMFMSGGRYAASRRRSKSASSTTLYAALDGSSGGGQHPLSWTSSTDALGTGAAPTLGARAVATSAQRVQRALSSSGLIASDRSAPTLVTMDARGAIAASAAGSGQRKVFGGEPACGGRWSAPVAHRAALRSQLPAQRPMQRPERSDQM